MIDSLSDGWQCFMALLALQRSLDGVSNGIGSFNEGFCLVKVPVVDVHVFLQIPPPVWFAFAHRKLAFVKVFKRHVKIAPRQKSHRLAF